MSCQKFSIGPAYLNLRLKNIVDNNGDVAKIKSVAHSGWQRIHYGLKHYIHYLKIDKSTVSTSIGSLHRKDPRGGHHLTIVIKVKGSCALTICLHTSVQKYHSLSFLIEKLFPINYHGQQKPSLWSGLGCPLVIPGMGK